METGPCPFDSGGVTGGHGRSVETGGFWKTVLIIELADLAFSLDNVVVAVQLDPEKRFWVIALGVGIGIIVMRFAAGIGGTGERAYVGGTLSANPLSCVAGYYSLLEMERTHAPVIAGCAGDRLTKGLQDIIKKYGLPFVAYNQGSIVHLETSGVMLLDLRHPIRLARELKPRKHMIEEMGAAYMSQGLVTLAGSRMYTSMVDRDEVIDQALRKFENVLAACV